MTKPFQDQAELGAFISTTNIIDIIPEKLEGADFRQFMVNLSSIINQISLLLNVKDTGYYFEQEFVCGQLYFPNPTLQVPAPASGQYPDPRQVFRKVISFGALPNNAPATAAHGITVLALDGAINYSGFTFTRIYGAASDTTNRLYIPLPYVADDGFDIALGVDATNVIITTTDNKSAFNTTYVVLEYIKE